VHVTGRLTLVDDLGPFGNPTSDSARTMVTTAAKRVLVVVFTPASAAQAGERAAEQTRVRLKTFCL
jgi:DNA/RNA-binding domain of Phe-tRNA-synthetase-like protein